MTIALTIHYLPRNAQNNPPILKSEALYTFLKLAHSIKHTFYPHEAKYVLEDDTKTYRYYIFRKTAKYKSNSFTI